MCGTHHFDFYTYGTRLAAIESGNWMNYDHLPIEQSIAGIYISPVLTAGLLGVVIAWFITRLMNRLQLARYIWHPPLFFLALCVICTGFVGTFIIPI